MTISLTSIDAFVQRYGTSEQKEQITILIDKIRNTYHKELTQIRDTPAGIQATFFATFAIDIFSATLCALNPWHKAIALMACNFGMGVVYDCKKPLRKDQNISLERDNGLNPAIAKEEIIWILQQLQELLKERQNGKNIATKAKYGQLVASGLVNLACQSMPFFSLPAPISYGLKIGSDFLPGLIGSRVSEHFDPSESKQDAAAFHKRHAL